MPLERQPWDGVECRQGNAVPSVTSLKIATRAAEGTHLDAEQMFKDAGDTSQNNVRPADLEDPKLRSKVEALLRTALLDDVEISKFVDGFVDRQFQGSMDTLKTFGLYNLKQLQEGDVPAPTPEQAKTILTAQVTREHLEVIKKMEEPTLQLIPVTSMVRYVEALDSYKQMDGQNDIDVSPRTQGVLEKADERDGAKDNTIIGWQIAVTEGSKEPKLFNDDNITKTLRERGAWFKQKFQRIGVSGVDLKRMLLALMMGFIKNEEPINDYVKLDGTYTFVNEEPEKDGCIFSVYWRDDFRQIRLDCVDAGGRNPRARFRASVVVDVPKA